MRDGADLGSKNHNMCLQRGVKLSYHYEMTIKTRRRTIKEAIMGAVHINYSGRAQTLYEKA
jgi:hypothetical protein